MSLEKTASEPASWSGLFKIPEPSKTKQLTTVAERDAYWAQTDDAMSIDASVRPYENLAWPAPVTEPMTGAEARAGLDFVGLVIPPLGPFADFSSGILAATNGQWVDAAISAVAMVPALGDAIAGGLKIGRKLPVANPGEITNITEEVTEYFTKKGSIIWGSNGYMDSNDIQNVLTEIRKTSDEKVKILSGVHGTRRGYIMEAEEYFDEDFAKFAHLPGVEVIDIMTLSNKEVRDLLEAPGIKIPALCNSENCLSYIYEQDVFPFGVK